MGDTATKPAEKPDVSTLDKAEAWLAKQYEGATEKTKEGLDFLKGNLKKIYDAGLTLDVNSDGKADINQLKEKVKGLGDKAKDLGEGFVGKLDIAGKKMAEGGRAIYTVVAETAQKVDEKSGNFFTDNGKALGLGLLGAILAGTLGGAGLLVALLVGLLVAAAASYFGMDDNGLLGGKPKTKTVELGKGRGKDGVTATIGQVKDKDGAEYDMALTGELEDKGKKAEFDTLVLTNKKTGAVITEKLNKLINNPIEADVVDNKIQVPLPALEALEKKASEEIEKRKPAAGNSDDGKSAAAKQKIEIVEQKDGEATVRYNGVDTENSATYTRTYKGKVEGNDLVITHYMIKHNDQVIAMEVPENLRKDGTFTIKGVVGADGKIDQPKLSASEDFKEIATQSYGDKFSNLPEGAIMVQNTPTGNLRQPGGGRGRGSDAANKREGFAAQPIPTDFA